MPTRFADLDNSDGAGEDNLLTVYNNIISDFSIPIASKDRTHHCKTNGPQGGVGACPWLSGCAPVSHCPTKYHYTLPQPTWLCSSLTFTTTSPVFGKGVDGIRDVSAPVPLSPSCPDRSFSQSHLSFPDIEALENRDPSLESDLSSRYGNICLVDYRVFLAAGEGTISETLSTSRGTTLAHEFGHSLGVWLASEGGRCDLQ